MSAKDCRKCGKSSAEVPFVAGKNLCNPCKAEEVRLHRARKAGKLPPDPAKPRGRPPRQQEFTRLPPAREQRLLSGDELSEALTSPQKRLQFMIARHQRSIEDFDRQRRVLDQRILDAEESGIAADVKDYTKMRQALTASAAEYDLKMSKELQVWEEFAAKEDSETPVEFVLNHLSDMPVGVVVQCVNDALQVKPEL